MTLATSWLARAILLGYRSTAEFGFSNRPAGRAASRYPITTRSGGPPANGLAVNPSSLIADNHANYLPGPPAW